LPTPHQMPLKHNPLFVGRTDDLKQLARMLKGGTTTAISPLAAATRMGGLGKTQLAAEFVHRYGQYFTGGVFWLSFADSAAVPSEIAACGGAGCLELRPDFAQLPLEDQVRAVLGAWSSPLPRLLIFDNCEDEQLLQQWCPPSGGCCVLVTSRRAHWDATLNVQALPLGVLSRSDSIDLLRKYRPDLLDSDADFAAVAEFVGDLPLALHLAGSFMRLEELTPAEYLAELTGAPSLDHESFIGEGVLPTEHDLSVYRTFKLSYDKLDPAVPTDALALQLLARSAYFAPGEPLPRDLLLATLAAPANPQPAKRQATKALTRLLNLGLLEREDRAVRLHRLIAAFVRSAADDAEAQAAVEQTILETASQLNHAGDPRPLLALQTHLRAVVDAAHGRTDEQAALCNELGYHLHMIGNYAGARPYYERALAIYEQVLGEQHPDTATTLNNLGLLLRVQGDYAGVRPYYERALAIYEQVLGKWHPNTATSLNNLGMLLQMEGDYAGARPYYERALAIVEQVLGALHPTTASSLNNLAVLSAYEGDFARAVPLMRRALAIQEQVLGPAHPDTVTLRQNLAVMEQRLTAQPVDAATQIAGITRQAEEAVAEVRRGGNAEQRDALIAALEARAQWAAEGETEGSPYLTLAERLRVLVAELRDMDAA